MNSFSSEVVVETDGKYTAVLKFNLEVSEYLKGDGPSSIVAVWLDGESYDTRTEAEGRKALSLKRRDDQWDDREAIIFLFNRPGGAGSWLREQLKLSGHFLLAVGDQYFKNDHYSLHSDMYKAWLPAESNISSHTGAGSNDDAQEFLMDVPASLGTAAGAGSDATAPTITLGNIKKRIEEVTAELNGGDGSDAYKKCVRQKYESERRDRYYKELKGRDLYGRSPMESTVKSGQSANFVLHQRQNNGIYPNQKAKTWLEGKDAALFTVAQGEPTPHDIDKDENLSAGVDAITFTESFATARPLPVGEYKIYLKEVWTPYLLCNYVVSLDWTITVTAPAGALHEAFFDPVAINDDIGADASNGVLKPASYTSGGTTTTINSIEWGSQQVSLDATSSLPSDHHIDFLALDASVALRLEVDDATATTSGGVTTHSWHVCNQPWSAGDKLMLRISSSSSDLTGVTNDEPCAAPTPEPTVEPTVEPSPTAVPTPTPVPQPPDRVVPTVTAGYGQLTASWDPPADNGSAITAYTVQSRHHPDGA